MTKNDLYAYLIREGVKRRYEVIPEFVVDLNERSSRKIDLVWAKRRRRHEGPQNRRNSEYWSLKAAFEIEGCNIPISEKGILRHKTCFEHLTEAYRCSVRKRIVVLYTEAHDRRVPFGNRKRLEEEIEDRIAWGYRARVCVIDGRDIKSMVRKAFGARRIQRPR